MEIAGQFEGDIVLDEGRVDVLESGVVRGPLTASHVQVAGRLEGDVCAQQMTIGEAGRVRGDVSTVRFSLEDGGGLEGTIRMAVATTDQKRDGIKSDLGADEGLDEEVER